MPHTPGQSIPHVPRQIFKFGGTSIGSIEAFGLALGHVKTAVDRAAPRSIDQAAADHPGARPVVVVSAMAGVTDSLLGAAEHAARGDTQTAIEAADAFQSRHLELCEKLLSPAAQAALRQQIAHAVAELHAICHSVSILRELSRRTLDAVAARGERVLAQIFAAVLAESYVPATYIDATEIIYLSRRAGGLWPDLLRCTQAAAQWIEPLVGAGQVPVMPGYIGRGPDGEVVTLGRGGTDFSAAILAHSLSAERVVLYKEVDGLMTADPRSVPEARVLPELHYREAAELAYYGAKILHPRTMIPLLQKQIPLFIRSTFNPDSPGTRIAGDVPPGRYPVKALSAIHGQALCSVEGNGMMGVPGIAARTFAALSQAGHSVAMISQASSESSICFVLSEKEAGSAKAALSACFAAEMQDGLVESVRIEPAIALLSVVGLGMRGTPGIAARTFAALARERINVLTIAQGSSELNITVGLREADTAAALMALHREFQLDRRRPLGDSDHRGREVDVTLLGCGQIGQALLRQVVRRGPELRGEPGLALRCVALCDRSAVLVAEDGFSDEQLVEIVGTKRAGRPLQELDRATRQGPVPGQLLHPLARTEWILEERLWSLPSRRPVFVDLSAGDTAPLLLAALRRGSHVVLANKKPLTVPMALYRELLGTAAERRAMLRYEATVGAGLPVLDTIAKLREAGDEIEGVLGCLSGTLGYLMVQLEEGVAFSEAVRRAHELGYTEPDPREDLSGMDVARKALILARTLGQEVELSDVAVEPLFPAELSHAEPARFMANLAALDDERRRQVQVARSKGQVLRYVARIHHRGASRFANERPQGSESQIRVGLEAVPEGSPMGRLRGSDNQVVFHTTRYRENPLVVLGPGAGAEVTAAGVFNDILAIARNAP